MSLKHFFNWIFILVASTSCLDAGTARETVVIHPAIYEGPIRNPLMGFIGPINGRHEYATLAREYVRWNAIENSARDGVDKLRAYSDTHWANVAEKNIKIVPRVFLEWPKGSGGGQDEAYWPIDSYWPADLPRDFASEEFKQRVIRMIAKMGEAWNRDPRIAFIEMGIIGPWGEQHHPSVSNEMQKLMGDAFAKAFQHKLVVNRYPWDFKDYKFGIHWDSFGNPGWEMRTHVPVLERRLADRWKISPMAGEMAFSIDPKSTKPRLGASPTDAVANHADTLIQYIRRWHWTALGWVSNYDGKNSAAVAGAARIQSAFGYRFVIDEVQYPARVEPGKKLSLALKVRNLGSAPIYENWTVEISLLNPTSHQPIWKTNFTKLDIRKWLPGEFSDQGKGQVIGDKEHTGFEWNTGLEYDIKPVSHDIKGTFKLSRDLPAGDYIVALSILDPAGDLPCARFAIKNYFKGGRHPIGRIGVGQNVFHPELDSAMFDDLASDKSLHYQVEIK